MISSEINQVHIPLKQKTMGSSMDSSTCSLCSQKKSVCSCQTVSSQKMVKKVAFMTDDGQIPTGPVAPVPVVAVAAPTQCKKVVGGSGVAGAAGVAGSAGVAGAAGVAGSTGVAGSAGDGAAGEGAVGTPFWLDDPNVLIAHPVFFPTQHMTYNEQMNAITRLVVIVSLLLFFVYRRLSTLVIGGITLFVICVIQLNDTDRIDAVVETFNNLNSSEQKVAAIVSEELKKKPFDEPKTNNPFSNVLLTDYMRNPHKKPAPPIDSPETENSILKSAKETVRLAHPTIPDIAEKLFTNLGDQYEFERSLQPFYSTASTTIPNNQKAFSEFCYGDMISCKEGNLFACARNSGPHTNY